MAMSMADCIGTSTVRINTIDANGTHWNGTGFYFSFGHGDKKEPDRIAVVTNKHVVRNMVGGEFVFSCFKNGESGRQFETCRKTVEDFEKRWIPHNERNVDLCILPLDEMIAELNAEGRELIYTAFDSSFIPSQKELRDDFSRIEEVVVVGYPNGIYDAVHNIPVVRRGITASPLQIDFENEPVFLVDAGIYPGSSGSPVFVYNNGTYVKGNATVVGSRLNFIGIVYGSFSYNAETKIFTPDEKDPIDTPFKSRVCNNLGCAIHARELLYFEDIDW